MRLKKTIFLLIVLITSTIQPCSARKVTDNETNWLIAYENYTTAEKLFNEKEYIKSVPYFQLTIDLLSKISKEKPEWNRSILQYRLKYCKENISFIKSKINEEMYENNFSELYEHTQHLYNELFRYQSLYTIANSPETVKTLNILHENIISKLTRNQEEKIEKIEKIINQLKNEIKKQEIVISDSEKTLVKYFKEIEKKKEIIKILTKKNNDLLNGTYNENLENELTSAKLAISKYKKEYNTLEKDLIDSKQNINNLEKKITTANISIIEYKRNIESEKLKNKKLKERLEVSKQNKNNLDKKIIATNKSIKEKTDKIENLTSINKEQITKIDHFNKGIKFLKNALKNDNTNDISSYNSFASNINKSNTIKWPIISNIDISIAPEPQENLLPYLHYFFYIIILLFCGLIYFYLNKKNKKKIISLRKNIVTLNKTISSYQNRINEETNEVDTLKAAHIQETQKNNEKNEELTNTVEQLKSGHKKEITSLQNNNNKLNKLIDTQKQEIKKLKNIEQPQDNNPIGFPPKTPRQQPLSTTTNKNDVKTPKIGESKALKKNETPTNKIIPEKFIIKTPAKKEQSADKTIPIPISEISRKTKKCSHCKKDNISSAKECRFCDKPID